MRTRGFSLVGVLVAALAPASALAADPPAAPPIAAAPAATSARVATPKASNANANAKAPAAEPLPEPSVRLWVVATAPQGPWTMRIDNEGDKPVRVPADVRLLRFEIEPEPEPYVAPVEAEVPKPKKWAPPKKPAQAIQCKIPAPLRPGSFPDASSLLLRPGESYVESFDPRLFCFGKEAAARLAGGAVVHVRFGWEAAKKPAWSSTKKPDSGPFAVEGTAFPPETLPLRELTAPTMVLRYGVAPKSPLPDASAEATAATEPSEPEAPAPGAAQPRAPAALAPAPSSSTAPAPAAPDPSASAHAASEPKIAAPGLVMLPSEPAPASVGAKSAAPELPIVDENAPRLELSATPFVEASSTSRASVTLTATNVGRRPMLLALNPRMFGFRVDGPDGVLRCSPMPPTHGIPRERFTTIKAGGSSSMTLLLDEGCTRDALKRPGLYRIQATLLAGESGAELGLTAYTGKIHARAPALLRVLDGPEPFYAITPRAIPTPKPPAPPEGDDGDE